jgi:hypothetical protein
VIAVVDVAMPTNPRALLASVIALVLLAFPTAAAADPFTAPGNQVLWGGQGGYRAGSIADFTAHAGEGFRKAQRSMR